MPRYASVVMEVASDRTFDYLIPRALAPSVVPGVRVYVPFRSRRMSAYVASVAEGEPHPSAKEILSVRDASPVVSEGLMRLAGWMASYYYCSLGAAISCILPASVRGGRGAKMPVFADLAPACPRDAAAIAGLCKGAPVQKRLLSFLISRGGAVPMQECLRRCAAAQGSLRALEKKGFVRLARRRVYRDPWEGESILPGTHLPPTPEQGRAIEHVRRSLDGGRFSVMLLHGITGSGKTEVYLQAIDEALKRGRGAIVLVPEIALTPQTVEGFKARFAEAVAVLHSRLSAGERLDEWEKLRAGKARVAVGARSAVFAPVAGLGLIVVDEEHEHTYKQEETPRYHARDVAVMRGSIEGATVLLGSATPSVESYRNALSGKYRLFHLPRRIKGRPLPEIAVVDMQEEIRRTGRLTFLSRRLLAGMEDRLEKGEQVILFLNRRGYSPVLLCSRCGFVQKCPNCSVSLAIHAGGTAMLCHLCGHTARPPERCPSCRLKSVRIPGLGTEKLEAIVSRLFPGVRAARMDTDSMAGKGAHAEVLAAFRRGDIRILLGTQMIAKGLHFPNVTLVGVVCADTALHLPDFRAAEHTFQLLTQVAGRAGRGDVHGEVIIQTYTPKHPAIVAARSHDYASFYRREIAFREELGYPPVKRFVLVTMRARGEEAVRWYARHAAQAVRAAAPEGIEVLGPAPSPIARAKGYYRRHIILKGESVIAMNAVLRDSLRPLASAKGIQIVVDADPISML